MRANFGVHTHFAMPNKILWYEHWNYNSLYMQTHSRGRYSYTWVLYPAMELGVNRRTTDLHTRIAELGVVWRHCGFFFQFLKKSVFLGKFFLKKSHFFQFFFPKMFFKNSIFQKIFLEMHILCSLEQPGTSWNILEHPGTSWNNLEQPGTTWNILKQPGTTCCFTRLQVQKWQAKDWSSNRAELATV